MKSCFEKADSADSVRFLRELWNLEKSEQDSFDARSNFKVIHYRTFNLSKFFCSLLCLLVLPLALAKLHTVLGNGHDARPSFTYCGEQVGRECLCALLGIGVNRLRKAFNMVPDLRVGKDKSGSHESTFSVDAFLSMLYSKVAETLPDRLLGWKCVVLIFVLIS